jgi:hypothetical protein
MITTSFFFEIWQVSSGELSPFCEFFLKKEYFFENFPVFKKIILKK